MSHVSDKFLLKFVLEHDDIVIYNDLTFLALMSPFCTKIEAYLRITGVKYKKKEALSHQAPTKNRLPYITYNGENFEDSTLPLKRLIAKKVVCALDEPLSEVEHAASVAFQCLLENHLYWSMMYEG
ncbi:hypothetical protein K7432_010871 [Basidiobolus ranarum]|uniref:Thioredoxin-like fold domain-containing protein n=1 Tax=Basidiobolus ranarum TaxID=34480 RepID=A0ABR2VUY6_9FUNG